ncbi:hypothetical protein PHLGIDRAFT_357788 [Phlebiopsis gigantea 11061_1 CR5-6]|uniref:Uncharacterized protein n=1 Tax=Phlebiopsis gigantea (strain 11061_1 CR5-6) TaxID=745531 RepID=A0A0C3NU91_PHLG1|nr:hypothetical protein PHLGIDRAFT_357788 [Phlebiopsis gigantea 11061_1 CR5-6]
MRTTSGVYWIRGYLGVATQPPGKCVSPHLRSLPLWSIFLLYSVATAATELVACILFYTRSWNNVIALCKIEHCKRHAPPLEAIHNLLDFLTSKSNHRPSSTPEACSHTLPVAAFTDGFVFMDGYYYSDRRALSGAALRCRRHLGVDGGLSRCRISVHYHL